jgi:hypothetical protein
MMKPPPEKAIVTLRSASIQQHTLSKVLRVAAKAFCPDIDGPVCPEIVGKAVLF